MNQLIKYDKKGKKYVINVPSWDDYAITPNANAIDSSETGDDDNGDGGGGTNSSITTYVLRGIMGLYWRIGVDDTDVSNPIFPVLFPEGNQLSSDYIFTTGGLVLIGQPNGFMFRIQIDDTNISNPIPYLNQIVLANNDDILLNSFYIQSSLRIWTASVDDSVVGGIFVID